MTAITSTQASVKEQLLLQTYSLFLLVGKELKRLNSWKQEVLHINDKISPG